MAGRRGSTGIGSFAALGAEVFTINVTPDGSFPRPAEPLPELDEVAGADAEVAVIVEGEEVAAEVLAENDEVVESSIVLRRLYSRLFDGRLNPIASRRIWHAILYVLHELFREYDGTIGRAFGFGPNARAGALYRMVTGG